MRPHRLVVVALTAISLVVVWPALTNVYRETGDSFSLSPWWLAEIVVAVTLQMAANIELHRMMLRTRARLDVAAPILAGNAISHLVPGGNPVGAGVQIRMMTTAGFPLTRIFTALGAITMIGSVSGFVVLPLIVLVASAAGSNVEADLIVAMWLGAAALLAVLIAVVVVARRDRVWRLLARVATRANRLVRREVDTAELERRLLDERDHIETTLRDNLPRLLAVDLARTLGDYLALYCALQATGAPVNPAAAMAAFIVSNLAGMIPLTPGGLGFVEAGLTGVLTVAGATSAQANLSVATYRLAATWLPCVAGLIAFVVFRRRHAQSPARMPA